MWTVSFFFCLSGMSIYLTGDRSSNFSAGLPVMFRIYKNFGSTIGESQGELDAR